ncbi:hypothetical protein F5X99DRAFT_415518 [Biscogniauxia marginata]|nr:hypothetical protein F5X99DRAFT_415518 [Biscogniauxia marginata]
MKSANIAQALLVAVATILYLWLRSRFAHSPEQTPAQDELTLSSRQERKGERETETDIDIIAIHGLDTNSLDTWVWKENPKDPRELGVNWLADKHMLPSVVGRARIFTCDWQAALFGTPELIQNTFEELARLLLDGIKRRPLATGDHGRKDRPILFIASCLGGIILTKALVMANDDEYLPIKTATRGIIFLATPFRGTAFQDVAKWAEPGLEAWASIRGHRVTKLLDLVKRSDRELIELVRSFTRLLRKEKYKVFTFYEKGYTDLCRKIPYMFSFPRPYKKQLVDEASATLDSVPNPLPLDQPHVLMNKFDCPEDSSYQLVSGKIKDFLEEILKGTPLQIADAHIRDEHYTEESLKIQRLSDEPLPMEQCYINLAIVEQLRENTHCSDDRPTDTASQPLPFSLPSRLKVETPDKKLQVELPTLFESRKISDGHTKNPRRILIRGRAGVGKTTLCKKIVYDFIHNMWQNFFAHVLWVPLRELKKNVTNRLAINDTNFYNVLFILDGLDEVSELLDTNYVASSFLMELLNKPNVIITTRPHIRLCYGFKKPDLELETIGFYPDQIQDYLKKVAKDVQKVEEIRSFLQKHRLLQSLVRIPIQLDALCLVWDEDLKGIPETMTTMTAIYRAIVHRLWKKDIVQLEKRPEIFVKSAGYSEIEDDIEPENELVQCLAFSGMYNNVVEFQPEHRDVIRKLVKPRKEGPALDELLGKLSFLRTSDPSANSSKRSYHFLHLTFQEFFAAQYFVRQWKGQKELKYLDFNTKKPKTLSISPVEFLKQNKYDARYDIVWRFAIGLFKPEEVPCFFDAVKQEPLDLLGPTHQRIIMHCLNEVDASTDLLIKPSLEETLSQWLLFECRLTGSSTLVGESEFPDQALCTALAADSGQERPLQLWWNCLKTQRRTSDLLPLKR